MCSKIHFRDTLKNLPNNDGRLLNPDSPCRESHHDENCTMIFSKNKALSAPSVIKILPLIGIIRYIAEFLKNFELCGRASRSFYKIQNCKNRPPKDRL